MKRIPFSIALVILFVSASCALSRAQTSGRADSSPSTQSAAQSADKTKADETFDLDISERRITEHDFKASTTVEAGEEAARGLSLRVGVSVGAEEIDLLLKNVRGHVRFRATLERVLDRINARRAPGAAP